MEVLFSITMDIFLTLFIVVVAKAGGSMLVQHSNYKYAYSADIILRLADIILRLDRVEIFC